MRLAEPWKQRETQNKSNGGADKVITWLSRRDKQEFESG